MRFSIVTPSLRSSAWLKLCIASVADQAVEVEHIVQDGGSEDGTQEWLKDDGRVRAFVEADAGMYDAINRGLRRSTGEILAYLNCDEQYLPGTLAAVDRYFVEHPDIDIVFGDGIVVGPSGSYLFHRPALLPMTWHTRVSGGLSVLTCATFFRRRVVEDYGLWFDTRYRVIADVQWILDALEHRVPMGLLRGFTSVFFFTGKNLSDGLVAANERQALLRSAPLWAQLLRPGIVAHHRLRKLLAGHYGGAAFDYAVHTHDSPAQRKRFHARRPTARWRMSST